MRLLGISSLFTTILQMRESSPTNPLSIKIKELHKDCFINVFSLCNVHNVFYIICGANTGYLAISVEAGRSL